MTTKANSDRALRALVGTGMFVIIVAGMRAAQSLIVPVLMAGFLAIICWPPLKWLQERRVPTVVALLIIVMAIAIVGALVGGLIGTSVNDFVGRLPQYEKDLREHRDAAVEWLEDKGFEIPKLLKGEHVAIPPVAVIEPAAETTGAAGETPTPTTEKLAVAEAEDPLAATVQGESAVQSKPAVPREPIFDLGYAVRMFGNVVGTLNSFMSNAVVILLIMVFMLLEAAGLSNKMKAIAANGAPEAEGTNEIAERVRHYVSLKTMISLLTGAMIVLLLKIIGVDYAVMWGMLAFFFNFVPNIGSFIAAVPAVLFALLDVGGAAAIWTSIGFLVVNLVIGNVVEPRMLGRGLGLSTLVVFLSLVFWGWVLGYIGMLLSVPLTMIAKIVLDASPETRWLAILLSSDVSPDADGAKSVSAVS